MKIALGIREFLPEKGGAERYCYDLMDFFADKGLEVHIYSSAFPESDRGLHFRKVHTIPRPKSLHVLSFAINCRRMMREERFDVIMGVGDTLYADVFQPHGGVHWKWFWRGISGYRKPIPWVFKFLGRVLSPKQWLKGLIENAPYAKAKKVIAISHIVKKDISDYYGVPEGRLVVVYNGVDTEHFHPRNRNIFRDKIRSYYNVRPENTLLLFVSHNFRLRGLRYLIQALPLAQEKNGNIKLLVVGRDKAGPYRRLAKRLGCADDVFFIGGIKDVERYYASADMLVHPTFYDPCSLVVLEALASGLPVITTPYAGMSEIITEEEGGFVLEDPRNIQLLAEKILFFSRSATFKKTSRAARSLAQRYSQRRCHQEMLNIFQKIDTCHNRLKQGYQVP
jgi:UDP-glucose:(heptosyl)LPS alpha-1,3-glucosyltransferase